MRIGRLVAAAALLTAGAGLAPAPAAAAPTHVAIVVRGVGTACVPAGQDGLGTLSSAFTVVYGQRQYAGFVLRIDGKGTDQPDDTHYWSYWHDTGSGWTYAQTGGAGYYPPAGSVEGWSYVDGQSSPPPPPAATYAAICAGRDPAPPPKPTPTPTATHRRPATSSAPAPQATTTHHWVAGQGTTTASAGSTAPAPVAARPTSSHPHPHPGAATTSSVTASHRTASALRLRQAAPVRSAEASRSSGGLPPWGTAAGIAVVALLGGAGWWLSRRRRTA